MQDERVVAQEQEVIVQEQVSKQEYQKPTLEPCGNWQELVATGTLPV